MKDISQNLIEILKYIVNDNNIPYRDKSNYFGTQLSIVKTNNIELFEFLKLYILNHQSWIITSESTNKLESCFDFSFQENLEHIDKSVILRLIEHFRNRDTYNFPLSTLLLEAVRFGYIEPTNEILIHQKNYRHLRHINPQIKQVFEIHFPDSYQTHLYFGYDRMAFMDYTLGNLEPDKGNIEFGGTISNLEEYGINRIITIDPIPNSISIESVTKLTIAMNFDKAFWIPIKLNSPYFLQHDLNGDPIKELVKLEKKEIEFYKEDPLVECYVKIVQTPSKYIHLTESKNEWRIGGMPFWIQEPEEVECPSCKQSMEFIIQLPSGDLKNIKGEGVHYGAHGITYGFWCDNDQIMGYIWQDT